MGKEGGMEKGLHLHKLDWEVLEREDGCLGNAWNPPINLALPLLALLSISTGDQCER